MLKALKDSRFWPLFFLGLALRVLPEKVKHQHRLGNISIWASSFPLKSDD